ncbi:MAG TPA: hypothetical protein VEA59_06215 [Patescibacteria group bacterium]|nr:hypothetical protein [Patescibacteria group bacterium]
MSQLEMKKLNILNELQSLCAHCQSGTRQGHHCPIALIRKQIISLSGVPLIVNNQFRGILAPT